MPNLRDLSDIQYRQKLAREYSHPSSGYIPTKQEIDEAIAVGTGGKPQDVAYGEQGLQAPAVAGGLVSLDPTDYLSGAGLAKIAAMAKVGGLGLASLASGMTAMHKMGAQSVPRMFGQAGMFAGRGAKTANLAMLAKAEEMAKAGIPDSQIWEETGWALNTPDKMPRFEIPDNEANVINLPINKSWEEFSRDIQLPPNAKAKQFKEYKRKIAEREDIYNAMNRTMRPIEDIYNHPQIYKEYPELLNLSAYHNPGIGKGGSYGGGKIEFGDVSNAEGVKGLFGHELQHAIQQREGFARGGSPESMAVEFSKIKQDQDFYSTLDALAREANRSYGGNVDKAAQALNDIGIEVTQDHIDELMRIGEKAAAHKSAQAQEALKSLGGGGMYGDAGHNLYQRLAGEAEARLTQARMNLTPEERLAQYPYDPEYFKGATGVNLKDLIVRNDGGTAMSMPESNIPELMSEAEKAMLRYELSKIPKKPAVSLRDLAIGGGAFGAGGLAGYYGIGATE